MHHRQRLRRVEVVVERGCEGLPLPAGFGLAAEDVAEALHLRGRLLERVVREVERLAPVAAEEVDEQRLAAPGVKGLAQRDDVAERLGHLLADELQHPVVHPEARELAAGAARLRDLVLVVRKDQVEPSAVNLEDRAEELLRHRRALDVPPGAASAPRRLPPCVFALLVRLPKGEVAGVFFQLTPLVFLGGVAHGLPVEAAGEPPVVGEAGDAVVDVSIGRIGEAALEQLLDQGDDLGDRLRGLGHVVGLAQAEVTRVLDVPARRLLRELRAVAGRGVVDLVVDVGDVVDELHVVPARAQPRPEPHRDHERARVPHMGARVHRRPADVHPDRARRRR